MSAFQAFEQLDIRVGRVRAARIHPTARKPSLQLEIDFGPLGTKHSSAQLTRLYRPEDLIGRQVIAIVNLPARRVADFTSEVLVLGAMPDPETVVLLGTDRPVDDGVRIG
jgi:tRNA-binding protein